MAPVPDAAQALAARFDSLRIAAHMPGLAVAVLRDTTVVLARGFGHADAAGVVPVTPDTPFDIASVSKTISAVVALRLVERGLLDLDRPMTSYDGFAEFCANAREQGGIFFRDYACDAPGFSLRHVLSMEANGTPGTRFFYNPVSYSWASRPMAQAAGIGFSALVAREVFGPAGMTHSARRFRALPLPAEMAARLAVPHHIDSAGRAVPSDPPPPQGDGAAGGVVSTVLDLARFDQALTRHQLLTPASERVMWAPGRSPTGEELPYGIDWFSQLHGGERLLWHTGLWEGRYSALYLKVPSRKLTMILLANSDGLNWDNPLDSATVHRSPFAQALLAAFPR